MLKNVLKQFTTLVLIGISVNLMAQDKYTFTPRMNLRIFGGLAAQNGATYNNLIADNKIGPWGGAFVGYRFDENSNEANYFGLFGNIAKINSASIQEWKSEQVAPIPQNYTGNVSYAYEVEAGFIFGDWFRLSGGMGTMQIPITGNWHNTKYYTGTGGFVLGKGAVNLHATTSVLFGGDLTKSAFRVSTGLGFNFKFLKSRKVNF